MANSKDYLFDRWTADQLNRINNDIDHLLPVAEFLVSKKALSSYNLEQLQQLNGEAQRSHFTLLVDRKYAPDSFIEALVVTKQYELAKALKPDLIIDPPPSDTRLSSGGGNCIGRPIGSITLELPSAGYSIGARLSMSLIKDKIEHTLAVSKYLVEKKALTSYDLDQIRNRSGQDQRSHFAMLVDRKYAPDVLIDALVATNQVDLAKAVVAEWVGSRARSHRSSLSGGDYGSEPSIGHRNNGSIETNEDITSESPSPGAIRHNEKFYRVEKELFAGIPRTDVFMSDLQVTRCVSLPAGFDSEKCYPHFSTPKGLALIFNNRFKRFRSDDLPERLGTDVDCKNLEQLLTELGYRVKIKHDLTAKEMLDAMSRFAFKSEHDNCHSAVVVVLSHGSHGYLAGSDAGLVAIDDLIKRLNGQHCPALRNKPKIFILQACRGESHDKGCSDERMATDGGLKSGSAGRDHYNTAARIRALRKLAEMDRTDAKSIADRTPKDADILVAYSTTPGYVSWRNHARGSWFIQAICEVFAREAHREEILHLFTEVNRIVAQNLSNTNDPELTDCVQVPEPASRLRKKFYFLPGL